MNSNVGGGVIIIDASSDNSSYTHELLTTEHYSIILGGPRGWQAGKGEEISKQAKSNNTNDDANDGLRKRGLAFARRASSQPDISSQILNHMHSNPLQSSPPLSLLLLLLQPTSFAPIAKRLSRPSDALI